MRALLSALLLACLAATAAAQPALSVSADPYDGEGDAPLVIRNVGTAPVSIDSIAFGWEVDRFGIGANVFVTTFNGGVPHQSFASCLPRWPCQGDISSAAGTLAPQDSLQIDLYRLCAICNRRDGAQQIGFDRDTLKLYYAGLAEPLRVIVTGFRPAGVAGEASPDAAHLDLSVSPNPAAALGTVHLSVAEPAASATATVYDALGRRVAVLHDGPLAAGPHDFALDTAALAPGVYVVRVVTAGSAAARVVTVAR